MTYSSLLPSTCLEQCLAASRPLDLFSRLGYLLHCPTDVEGFWSRLLALLGEVLACSTAQLYLAPAIAADSDDYSWGESNQPFASEQVAELWNFLEIFPDPGSASLGNDQIWELKAQLAAWTFEGELHSHPARSFTAQRWPSQLQQKFSSMSDQHALLLPLCERTSRSGLGLLVFFRSSTSAPWTNNEIRQIERLASRIFLSMQRSLLDRLSFNRSTLDQLTQLPDRTLFHQQLTLSIAQAASRDLMLGVAFLDLDRFKNINDTLGHAAGDCLIKQVSKRLQNCLRSYDLVARWGGDEFTLLLPGLQSAEDISLIAERILQRLAAPFYIQEQELYVTASLGIALAPYDGEDEQTLLRNADAAMYQAKARGRNNYQIYFEEINADARTQLNLETDLRKALDASELFLCYQPQVDLRTGQWIGLEALVRWQHPELGLISPGRFIPIAEETGLIEPIGQWVLQAACEQYCQWHSRGFPQLRLAVNLSAQQFQRSSLVRSVMNILAATGFDPHCLELEVTESAAMHDVQFAINVLKKLSHTGIQIAMDDFGTGYSSLSVLKHFPLDTLKIDRSFVMDLVDNPSDAAIASTIIALAKGLNFKVLAEGIETADQVKVLTAMGCDYAQGYWYSRPLTVAQIDEMLRSGTLLNDSQRDAKTKHADQRPSCPKNARG